MILQVSWQNAIYLVGYIAQAAFFLRFFVQYVASEKKRTSVTPPLFWKLSLLGNIGLLIYSLLLHHYPMSLAQSQNAILSWRNLNLLGPVSRQVRFKTVVFSLISAALLCTLFFFNFCSSWTPQPDLSWGIHLLGIVGIIFFGLRFWVQWWLAETKKSGELNELFWWMSLFGAILSGTYFYISRDWVNFIGPMVCVLPYSRNLYFLRREKSHAQG
jgi:lipid-A-disaccharide synthase